LSKGFQTLIDCFKRAAHFLALIAVIPHGLSHHIAVFLFHEAIVGLTVGTAGAMRLVNWMLF
jgi:hypothetical protein